MIKRSIIAMSVLLFFGCAAATKFTIVTDPAGAVITIDGKQAGKTPATVTVKFSENAQLVKEKKILVVRLPGYQEQKEVISDDGVPDKKLHFTLIPEPGYKAAEDAVSAQTGSATKDAKIVSAPSGTAARKDTTETGTNPPGAPVQITTPK